MPSPDQTILEDRVVSKVFWRLVPFMMLLYWFNYLDRVNISVAKLQMSPDLKLDEDVFGWGAAIFYVGYFFFEVPSNILLEKLGARIWIARIMISWGLVSLCFAYVQGAWSFYALRVLLGVTEAGFFPGMLLFLTYWIPARQRAKVGAVFMTSIPLACALGQPLCGWIMDHATGYLGYRGWQWLFLIAGSLTVLLGFSVFYFMTDKPAEAMWLKKDERDLLTERIESERKAAHDGHGKHRMMDAMKSPRVWLLSFIYMALMFGFYCIIYWTPTMTKDVYTREFGVRPSDTLSGLLSAIPYVAATIGMVLIGLFSDRTGRRREFVVPCMLLGALGLFSAAHTQSTFWTLVWLSAAAVGIIGTLSPFWTLPPMFLTGTAAATGIAFINSWGNLGGGFVGSWMMGAFKQRYKSFESALLISAGVLVVGALLTLLASAQKPAAAIESDALRAATE